MKTFKFFHGIKGYSFVRWRSYNGDVGCIHDMTTNHIRNVINCLRGTGNMRIPNPYEGKSVFEWLIIFRDELRRRNETL